MKYFIIMLSFMFFETLALDIERQGSKIVIKADECKDIISELNDLEAWTKSSGGSCKRSSIRPSGTPCKADISNCIPEHVFKYHGTNPDISGPNCWNLSLVLAGLIPALRYSTPEELSFFMDKSSLCRAIDNSEDRKPGDIGAMRGGSSGIDFHSFIYVSENLVYSKNGHDKENPFALQSSWAGFEKHFLEDVPEKCKQNRRPENNEKCGKHNEYVEFFRCRTLDDYLKDNLGSISNEMRETLSMIDQIECNISMFFFNSSILNKTTLSLIVNIAFVLNEYIKKEVEDLKDRSDEDKHLLAVAKIRLESMSRGIQEYLRGDSSLNLDPLNLDSEVNHSLHNLENMIKSSAREIDNISQKKTLLELLGF